MTRKKSKTKRVAPEPPKQEIVKPIAPDAPEIKVVTRKTWQIPLPQEVIDLAEMTHVSIPSKWGGNIIKLLFSFLFLLFLFLPLAFYSDHIKSHDSPEFASGLVACFLFLILAVIGYRVLKFAYKLENHAPRTVYVTPTELYFEDVRISEKKNIYITWANVISNPESYVDVRFTTVTRSESELKYWHFFEKDGERRVSSKLGINDLRAMGIKNKWAINRAILANFAVHAKEPLAISPDVLVSLEINPITWQRNWWPKYIERVFYCIACLAAIVPIFIEIPQAHLYGELETRAGIFFLVILFISIPIGVIGYQLASYLHPEFYGDNITFIHAKKAKRSKKKSEFGKAIDAFFNSATT